MKIILGRTCKITHELEKGKKYFENLTIANTFKNRETDYI